MMPRITLTKDDERELNQLGDELEAEFLAEYEHYLYTRERHVDTNRWKQLRDKDDMRVFRERDRAHSSASSSSEATTNWSETDGRLSTIASSSSDDTDSFRRMRRSTMEIGPLQAMAASWPLPVLMATGTAPGNLDDAMFGVAIHDAETLRARGLYRKEAMSDCAVLSTLQPATMDDPYKFMGITWVLADIPIFNTILKSRDFIMYASIHMTFTSRGERIGLAVYHPVSHRGLPEKTAPRIVRARHSLCVAFRQFDDQRIEIYVSQSVDPAGRAPEMIVLKEMSNMLLAYVNVPEVGLRKKLRWLMGQRQHQRSISSAGTGSDPDDATTGHACCYACDKRLGGLFSGHGSICQLCFQLVCSKCRVAKKVVVQVTVVSEAMKTFDFCLPCMVVAKATPSLTIAQKDLEARHKSDGAPRGLLV